MLRLLSTQENELFAVIDATRFDVGEFSFDRSTPYPIMRFSAEPTTFFFGVEERSQDGSVYRVDYAPGQNVHRLKTSTSLWSGVLDHFRVWLTNLERELSAAERRFVAAEAPDWAIQELPSEYAVLCVQISTLQERQRRLARMAGLLWQTGESLNKLVRDAFRATGYTAEVTAAGATYDVEVTKDREAKLLIEVTGINGQITKDSKKIAQVLAARQLMNSPRDRVAVAVNAYREQPVRARTGRDIATPEAIALLTGLGAVVFTTADLFEVWKIAMGDVAAATQRISRIFDAPPGVLRLGNP